MTSTAHARLTPRDNGPRDTAGTLAGGKAHSDVTAYPTTMQAVVANGYGATTVLDNVERPTPTPGDDEVLVKVHATNVSAADSMMRRGDPAYARLFLGVRKPKKEIPGTCLSGVVCAVGSAVKQFKVGDAVYGGTGVGFGAHAEYVCVPEDGAIVAKPETMTHQDAALMFDGPSTSWNFLKRIAQVQPGQKVLVNGASGSLGTAGVQLAKAFGAHVTGVCSAGNADLVRSLGADVVIDYAQADFTRNADSYDVIYDTIGKSSFGRCKRALKRNGQYLTPVLKLPSLFRVLWTKIVGRKRVRFDASGLRPAAEHRAAFLELAALMEAGKLHFVIERTYRLEEIAEAHERVDSGHKVGNLAIRVANYSGAHRS
ncbi:MAG: NADPH:quinone reductase-like Zn-dependent oxidoreductase [Myxococcota bacterium]|jgi:NADPH:quinone reductase-like Zn-dependent oxidoreductase